MRRDVKSSDSCAVKNTEKQLHLLT